MKLHLPKRWFNRLLCYAGCFGLVFQVTAAIHAWWYNIPLDYFWWMLLAPLLCLLSGLSPALQIQKEHH
ncbi:hypothetical protein [Alishewanella tabrizica]|uniref:hypothetical protein n=1 Tax=Alishewanella tabrizica TaxID=671278 RepID=UPI001673B4D6|nr:hypothetical protein [Alishewanella tabrizica]